MRERWEAHRSRRDLWTLAGLLFAGVALRVWLTATWRPAMLGYSDTGGYLEAAAGALFRNEHQPGGYPLFLRFVHLFGADLTLVAVLQHALGVATALLLWAAARRLGTGRWAALLPVAVVLLFGTGIFVEHAVLTESVFAALQALAVYALARTREDGRLLWAAAVGAAIASAACVRVVGIAFVPLLVTATAVLGAGGWRPRATRAGAAALAAVAVLFPFAVAHANQTGVFGLTRAGAWNLYGRIAVFADCREFTPPAGTEQLCETTPTSERFGPNEYVHNFARSPARQVFGNPASLPPEKNQLVADFARAAIVGTPLTYAKVVADDLRRYWDSEGWIDPGDGLSYAGLVRDYLLTQPERQLQPYWDNTGYSTHGMGFLGGYERATRIQGPFLLVLVALALAGPLLARGRRRLDAAVPALLGLGGLVIPVAAYMYDARFAIPAYGVLALAAALGIGAVVERRLSGRGRDESPPGRDADPGARLAPRSAPASRGAPAGR